jgi:hypothetical protein
LELPFEDSSAPSTPSLIARQLIYQLLIRNQLDSSPVSPNEPESSIALTYASPSEQQAALLETISEELADIAWDTTHLGHELVHQPRQDSEPEQPISPEEQAFQSLNLQSRFWSRLNALASDSELSSWLRRVDPIESLPITDAPLGIDTDLAAMEVVVDDETPPVKPLQPQTLPNSAPLRRTISESSPIFVLSKDEPIPTPQLGIPAGELTAGKPVRVTVKLPALESRIYVKLWAHDRQSRTLVDGPRWLVDFIPTNSDELEAQTQVIIPFGCMEIQFEAIAVEMATQRESHKVTSDRSIVPPDLPNLFPNDLNDCISLDK